MININILDDSDGYTYSLSFSDDDARKAVINWGKQVIKLDSIGGEFLVQNGHVSLSYRNGGEGLTGQISCSHQHLINLLNDPDNKADEFDED